MSILHQDEARLKFDSSTSGLGSMTSVTLARPVIYLFISLFHSQVPKDNADKIEKGKITRFLHWARDSLKILFVSSLMFDGVEQYGEND